MTTTPLKHVATMHGRIGWQNLRRDEFTDVGPFLVTGMHFAVDGRVDWDQCFHITHERWSIAPEIQLRPQDVLVTKDGSIGKIAFVEDLPGPAALNSHLLVVRPIRGAFIPRFLFYVLNSQVFIDFIDVEKRGTTFDGLTQESMGKLPMPLPPPPIQLAIADYLDRETAQVDALMAAKRRMVELLEERVWLAFNNRVLASDPKPTALRRALRSLIDGPFGSAFSSSDYSDNGAVVVRLGNIGFSEYRGADEAHIPLALYERFRPYRVVQGDLLIAGLGDDRNHAGRACIAPDLGPAIVKGKCFRGRVDESRANADFLSLLLSSPLGAEAMNISGRGSTRSMINLEIVKSTVLPLPTTGDQDSIVTETREDQANTAATKRVLLRQIELLDERRQAVITATVTGQIDIPDAA